MSSSNEPALGHSLLRLVTSGMYDDPLTLYREYLQNAADATAGSPETGRVEIHLDPRQAQIRIRDYGPGLTFQEAVDSLIPVGQSTKRAASNRGFRGIGRLAGLAFAEAVAFTTRASADQPPVRVTWDALRLRNHDLADTEQRIGDFVTVEHLDADEEPDQYFEVEVRGVARYAAGSVLNRQRVQSYIAEFCPVPLAAAFPFCERVEQHVGDALDAMNVSIDGGDAITRPMPRASSSRPAEPTPSEPSRCSTSPRSTAAGERQQGGLLTPPTWEQSPRARESEDLERGPETSKSAAKASLTICSSRTASIDGQ